MSSAPPSPRPPGSPWRHALEGALSVTTAVTAMAIAAWAALTVLGAGAIAPVSRLVPMMVSMAVGGGVTVESSPSAESADGGGLGGGLGGLLGGLGGGGGLSLGLTGEAAVTPLTLTFLGTAVLAIGFFRPLRRRQRPAAALLWARCGGALLTAAVVLPILAGMAHGTARLPESVTDRFGKGASSGALSRFGGGGGGGLTKGLSSIVFETDAAATAFLGLLWVGAVLALGCLAARRTTLPRPLALSRLRLKWNAVTSTVSGIFAVLCCSTLVIALLAGAAALTGRDQAAKAAGLLLLLGPNLIGVLLTAGFGTSWEAGVHRLQAEGGGGMLGMLGGAAQGDAAGTDKSFDIGGWSGAGVPLWLIAMALMAILLTVAGYVVSARTPARTPREDSEGLLDRHAEIALRTGIAVAVSALFLPLLTQGSVRIGISIMGNEMGGMTAGLDGSAGLSALTGFVLAFLASYAGSRLHSGRARRKGLVPQPPGGTSRRPAATRPATRVPSDSAL
ncbi:MULTISPECIES: streptophobe family protein [unclassified Streptomyces]|uniref:streptophobe family protein n=1 Tax=unclassified Streptomyces TaxID=2593676 RepID=UPI001C31278F|nr:MULTISPECIES: streptophobe family protein [unclassified Streptomyces]